MRLLCLLVATGAVVAVASGCTQGHRATMDPSPSDAASATTHPRAGLAFTGELHVSAGCVKVGSSIVLILPVDWRVEGRHLKRLNPALNLPDGTRVSGEGTLNAPENLASCPASERPAKPVVIDLLSLSRTTSQP